MRTIYRQILALEGVLSIQFSSSKQTPKSHEILSWQGATIHTSEGLLLDVIQRDVAAPAALQDGFQPQVQQNGNGATPLMAPSSCNSSQNGNGATSKGLDSDDEEVASRTTDDVVRTRRKEAKESEQIAGSL